MVLPNLSLEHQPSFSTTFESGQDAQHRSFATARWSAEGQQFPSSKVKIHIQFEGALSISQVQGTIEGTYQLIHGCERRL